MAGNLTAMIASIFSGSAVSTDPYFNYTTLLLPGNGTNGAQNNTFLDGSTNNFTITRNGNTTQGTFSPFSQTGWGNYFDGSSYLSLGVNSAFDLGTGDFSIECWVYPLNTATNKVWIGAHQAGNADGYYIYLNPFQLQVYSNGGGGGGVTSTTAPTVNIWNHLLVTRQSGRLRCFLNGVLTDTNATSYTINQDGRDFRIANIVGSAQITAYLSNIRFIKGSVPTGYQTSSTTVGTSIFTPSTTAITLTSQGAVSNDVKVLTCQSNRFIDNSTNNFTITTSGSPSVVAFSPFNPTASWSAATYGGSGYFDGNGDYLSVPSNTAFDLGTGTFTLEAWVYRTVSGSVNIFHGSSAGLILYIDSSNKAVVRLFGVANLLTSADAIAINTWTHVAVARSGTTLSMWLNGSRSSGGTVTNSSNFAQTGVIIGANDIFSGIYSGYMSSVRLVKGTAVYDPTQTTITVPTAPLTAITNTSLLLNFTNAGIYDATSKNDLETVGNAQISTTQSKWGGSSISFDGTGDWLLIPDQPPQRIGTGNFTIEMWVYRNSSGTYGLAGKGTGTTGWLVSLNSSNQVVFTYGSSTITSSGTVSATTWTHIAVVREGTSTNQTKIYISGTNDGTGTVSTDFNQTNSMYIGADRTGGSAANAYVQDVRITNYARYTTNFTPPTAAFPTL